MRKMIQLELLGLDDPGAYAGKVIREENPYVKILGDITWSSDYQSYTAVAQVNTSLCVVSLIIKEESLS